MVYTIISPAPKQCLAHHGHSIYICLMKQYLLFQVNANVCYLKTKFDTIFEIRKLR